MRHGHRAGGDHATRARARRPTRRAPAPGSSARRRSKRRTRLPVATAETPARPRKIDERVAVRQEHEGREARRGELPPRSPGAIVVGRDHQLEPDRQRDDEDGDAQQVAREAEQRHEPEAEREPEVRRRRASDRRAAAGEPRAARTASRPWAASRSRGWRPSGPSGHHEDVAQRAKERVRPEVRGENEEALLEGRRRRTGGASRSGPACAGRSWNGSASNSQKTRTAASVSAPTAIQRARSAHAEGLRARERDAEVRRNSRGRGEGACVAIREARIGRGWAAAARGANRRAGLRERECTASRAPTPSMRSTAPVRANVTCAVGSRWFRYAARRLRAPSRAATGGRRPRGRENLAAGGRRGRPIGSPMRPPGLIRARWRATLSPRRRPRPAGWVPRIGPAAASSAPGRASLGVTPYGPAAHPRGRDHAGPVVAHPQANAAA